jgi:hypothetical protein
VGPFLIVFYPNSRDNPAGALPVYLSASPKAMLITMGAQPTVPDAGAIPVRFVTAPTNPPYPNDQGNDTSAIPVVVSASLKAIPVWDVVTPAPLPPEVISSTITRVLSTLNPPTVLGVIACNNGPATWSIINNPGPLNLFMSGTSGQLLIMSIVGTALGVFPVLVEASNVNGAGVGTVIVELT